MNLEDIREIVTTYEKYDWKLRAVLLTGKIKTRIGKDIENAFPGAEIRDSKIDAAWFSRASRHNREVWELRVLRKQPFALLETFRDDLDESSRDKIRDEMETRLAGSTSEK
ncbi:MAG: hypothetical protein R2681_07670 [Pyrinomonadaceae bacterium]